MGVRARMKRRGAWGELVGKEKGNRNRRRKRRKRERRRERRRSRGWKKKDYKL